MRTCQCMHRPEQRKQAITTQSLDFLDGGVTYTMTSFEDGVNAARQGLDYRMQEGEVKNKESIKLKLVRNGGYAARLLPKK